MNQFSHFLTALLLTTMITLLLSTGTQAKQTNQELAKKTQNPLADLISVPFQNNLNFGLGPHNRAQNILNIQPVVPFHPTKDINLITRTIVPIIRQPDLTKDSGDTNGLGDINLSLFFSPANSGQVIWGLALFSNFRRPPMKSWVPENGVPGRQASLSLNRAPGSLELLPIKSGPTRATLIEIR